MKTDEDKSRLYDITDLMAIECKRIEDLEDYRDNWKSTVDDLAEEEIELEPWIDFIRRATSQAETYLAKLNMCNCSRSLN